MSFLGLYIYQSFWMFRNTRPAKEPHVPAKEPHISTKESHISAKEPDISTKEPSHI